MRREYVVEEIIKSYDVSSEKYTSRETIVYFWVLLFLYKWTQNVLKYSRNYGTLFANLTRLQNDLFRRSLQFRLYSIDVIINDFDQFWLKVKCGDLTQKRVIDCEKQTHIRGPKLERFLVNILEEKSTN